MANGDGRFGPTWKWIAVTVVGILVTLALTSFVGVRSDIKDLDEKKADRREVSEMKGKIDRIYDCFLEKGLVRPVTP